MMKMGKMILEENKNNKKVISCLIRTPTEYRALVQEKHSLTIQTETAGHTHFYELV